MCMYLGVKMLQEPANIWLSIEFPRPFIDTSVIRKLTTFSFLVLICTPATDDLHFHSFSPSPFPLQSDVVSSLTFRMLFVRFYIFSCSRYVGLQVTLKSVAFDGCIRDLNMSRHCVQLRTVNSPLNR